MTKINRRTFVHTGAVSAGFLIGGSLSKSLGADPKPGATVETLLGRIRGLNIDGVNAFKGIQYSQPTDGPRRFMPPVRPIAWTGTIDAFQFGDEAPQAQPHTEIAEVLATVPKVGMSEDCLRLNVWSKDLKPGKKAPVMVWLHGGGFASGNGAYTIYDGANLARKRDVVVVTLNHRLNSFGFLDLSTVSSGDYQPNAGMLDIIEALTWVRDNIGRFGGDPGNVTIFGQSGGGAKVSTLLAMPAAQTLFHKAIVQSASQLTGFTTAQAASTAQAFMAKLGAKTAADLQKMPMQQLIDATNATPGLRLGPVVRGSGSNLPRDPFTPNASPLSPNIPLLIGSTETEVAFFPNQSLDPIDDAQLLTRMKAAAGATDEQARDLISLYKKGRPGVSNIDVALITESDVRFRAGVLTEAERKSAQPAPVYMYYFTWRSPVHDGKLKAFHTLEIPFVTETIDQAQTMTGTGKDRYALSDKMAAAWTTFARTGNPNHKGLPTWPKFDIAKRATMIFNNECKVVDDPNGAERLALAAIRKA